jgi:hypothetical protein
MRPLPPPGIAAIELLRVLDLGPLPLTTASYADFSHGPPKPRRPRWDGPAPPIEFKTSKRRQRRESGRQNAKAAGHR